MTQHIFERTYREIPIACIDEPELPARSRMDEARLESLVGKMRQYGFQSVIGVFPKGENFEVVYGHRRRIAAARAGLVAIPCFVYPTKDVALEALKHMENAEREALSPTDEAIYFDQVLQRDCGGDTNQLAAQLGLKRDYVERRLLLLSGHEDVFRALEADEIGIGIAETINKCTDVAHVRYMLHQAITCGWTLGVAAQALSDWKHLHSHTQPEGGAGAPSGVPGPPVADDYFTCRVCGLKENPSNMRPVQIHDYCQQAVFFPALDFFQRRRDFVEWPRTHDEAIALIEKLAERFPSLAEESAVTE